MPYEKDGVIYVLCGQGADGDYDGGDSLTSGAVPLRGLRTQLRLRYAGGWNVGG